MHLDFDVWQQILKGTFLPVDILRTDNYIHINIVTDVWKSELEFSKEIFLKHSLHFFRPQRKKAPKYALNS